MRRGFTLIELLIVIGILAILSTTVLLVLNPAEYFRQSRDAKRISDLSAIRDAIGIYLARASNPTLNSTVCTASAPNSLHGWRASGLGGGGGASPMPSAGQPFLYPDNCSGSCDAVNSADFRKVDGTGWVPVPFNSLSEGSPIGALPVDPNHYGGNDLTGKANSNPAGRFYAYQCRGLTYEINANMESVKYSSGGSRDVESTDGGTRACWGTGGIAARCDPAPSRCGSFTCADLIYEIGNDPGLDL